MNTTHVERPKPQSRPGQAIAAGILDLLLGLLVGALAVTLAAEPHVDGSPPTPIGFVGWLGVVATASLGAAAVLFVLAGVRLVSRRGAGAARAGQVAIGISVVLIDGSLLTTGNTSEELAGYIMPILWTFVFIVTVVGLVAWGINQNAYRQLSGGGGKV